MPRALVALSILVASLAFLPVAVQQVVAAAGDPKVAAAGDIACDPADPDFNGGNGVAGQCRQKSVSDLLVGGGFAAVLALGDVQYYCGSLAAMENSYDLSWGRIKSITHPVVGNHEYLTAGGTSPATGCDPTNAGAAGYFGYFGSAAGAAGAGYYSYDIGAWHLIALNSNCADAGGCTTKSPQGMWLASDLAAHPQQCTLAYWHIPLFSSGGRAAANTQTFWNLLYAAGADLILDGHDHIYERFDPQTPAGVADPVNGIRQITVGTGGANHTSIVTPAANSVVNDVTTFGVLSLTLHQGSYDWNFDPVEGSFTDSGSAACHHPAPTPTPAPTKTPKLSSPTPPPNTAPGKPTDVLATSGTLSARLSWSAPVSDGGSPITGYKATSAPGGKTCTTIAALSCTISGLTGGQNYTFTVKATNGVGTGPPSAPSTAVLALSGATYNAIAPARILDTRDGTGGLAGPLSSHHAQTFQVTGDHLVNGQDLSIPGTAIAVTGNLTVTQQNSTGFLYLGPNAADDPTSSTLNFPVGDDRANAVTVALSGTGTLSVTYAAPTLGPTAHVIFDVTGYFTPDGNGATYHALPPTRILDSRDGTGGLAGPFSSHVARSFQVGGGPGGVPSDAIAVTGNLTVTQQSALGFLSVGPDQQNVPTSSTLNFPRGDDRANAVTVALGTGGVLWITYAAPTLGPTAHVIFDVTGYFTADLTGATYVPVTPVRLLDSRNGTGGASVFSSHVAQTFPVAGPANGVAGTAIAVTGNLTVTQQSSLGFLYIGGQAENNPTSSNLNFPFGDDRANAVTVALGSGGVLAVTYAAPAVGPTAQAIFDVTGYFTP